MNYLSPGVYIEEVPSGPQPIAAAPTSVVAILGTTRKGPQMEPTRVTGWAEFRERFGDPIPGLFTAESVYGFFENGGPAAYIVRVDPSLSAQWRVNDGAGNEAFVIDASSPGAWANALDISVVPDTTGGSGQTAQAVVAADTSLPASASTAVPVGSAVGFAVGDKLQLIRADGSTAPAVVDNVAEGTVTLTKQGAGAFDLEAGDRITARFDGGDTTIKLAAGTGFKAGDLIVAELADRTRVTRLIESVTSAGAGMVLTLEAGFGSAVPGAQRAARTARFRGTIGTLDTTVALGEITWTEEAGLEPTADDMETQYRAYAANGLQGDWQPIGAAGNFEFPVAPPSGPIEVEAELVAHRYVENVNLATPTLAALSARYSFVPEGTEIRLSVGGAAPEATLTMGPTGFTTGDSLAETFTRAEFVLPADASDGVVVKCARPPRIGDVVAFGADRLAITNVDSPGGNLYVLDFDDTADISGAGDRFALEAVEPTLFSPLRFAITVADAGTSVERFAGLALHASHPQYYFRGGVVNDASRLIRVTERAADPITATSLPVAVARTRDGRDDPAQPSHFKAGLAALEAEPEPAMVICPDAVTLEDPLVAADVVSAVVAHCENFRRFAIVDAPRIRDDQDLVTWRNQTVASTYAAVFAPHVKIVSLEREPAQRFAYVPPSGFVAGVMARTDRERGVHKAPGNERVRGIVGLDETYTQRRQDLLNPNGVNLIRAFPGRGTRIWGARNATDEVTWRYVNVRRLFNQVETSVERGTQWVVFEPNTASTWLRVKVSVENFLDQLWRAGALAGTSPAEAYRVRVGLGETMTETDVDLGLVIVEVAIAPAKPAEFVVFRFSHKRLSE